MAAESVHLLHQLARQYGVQTAYLDVSRRRRHASPETLFAVLRALGASLESAYDLPAALRERRQALWQRSIEPVVVAWDGGPAQLELRVPEHWGLHTIACSLTLETSEIRRWTCQPDQLPTLHVHTVEGVSYVAQGLSVPASLPWGYHRLTVETQGRLFETTIISAPRRAYSSGNGSKRRWGVFLPLYALHSKRSCGAGDFTDLESLAEWTGSFGGDIVATLPVLAAFLDTPYDPSPYAPASRLFWNEFHVDVRRIPELKGCPEAQDLLESGELESELERLRSSSLVDYRRQMALKRKVLEPLARYFFTGTTERYDGFQRFVKAHPRVEDYARFRATGERQASPWPSWPARPRDGNLDEGDYDEAAMRYHLYVQWVAHEQLRMLSDKTRAAGVGLYLDLPLGVHHYSYDVWRERDVFALEVSGGAPPDVVFTKGQNWGFPPLHPEAIRRQGYRYFIDYVSHQLQHTSMLRVDHVMALHRLFWIPKGLESCEGVYVRYPAEELYAILSCESHRHRAEVIGENLGTVPAYVNSTMRRHNIQQMYVVQYELNPGARRVLRPVPPDCVASLNTHDMPPFAAYWQCLDIDDRLALGLLDPPGARMERKNRRALQHALERFLRSKGFLKTKRPSRRALLEACLVYLSASPARVVLVNLEDLWLEKQPQNVPGTTDQHPNWQRKARYSLEQCSEMPAVLATLRKINDLRKGKKSPGRTHSEIRKR